MAYFANFESKLSAMRTVIVFFALLLIAPTIHAQKCRLEVDEQLDDGSRKRLTGSRLLGKGEHEFLSCQILQEGDAYSLEITFTLKTLEEMALPVIQKGGELVFRLQDGQMMRLYAKQASRGESLTQESNQENGAGLDVNRYTVKGSYPITQEQMEQLTQLPPPRLRFRYTLDGVESKADLFVKEQSQNGLTSSIACMLKP